MITEIYVNGDSYSAGITPYSKFLNDLTDIPVINDAMAGSSNDRIFRTTLEYCTTIPKTKKSLIIIGFSFVTREETWIKNISPYSHRIKDYPGSKFISTGWLDRDPVNTQTQHLIIDQNINKQMVNFYTKLFMLSQTLKQLDVPYFIFSAANNSDFKELDWNSLNNLNIHQLVKQDTSIANLHTFNIPTWADEHQIPTTSTGHLYTDGHKQFADFLYQNYIHNLLTK
jgi:hypothetical protein